MSSLKRSFSCPSQTITSSSLPPCSSSSSQPLFEITTHIISLPRFREETPDVSNYAPHVENRGWRLSVKQYHPLDNLGNTRESKGDVTILASGGNGYVKELYEPLWDDLYHSLKRKGIKIRGIWIADQANMGDSARLNRHLLYDPMSTFDHSRDLLHLVSLFPEHFQHPIIGIGHSVGATQLANLSLIHPTLLRSLILLDPIFVHSAQTAGVNALIEFALRRKNTWRTRTEAERYFNGAWKGWDKRALNKWMEFAIESKDGNGESKLVWTRQQELIAYMQFPHTAFPQPEGIEQKKLGFDDYVLWPLRLNSLLHTISPSTLVLCGAKSPSASKPARDDWQARIGSDSNFRRPKTVRNVKVEALEGRGHLFPMESPGEVAERLAVWIGDEVGDGSAWQAERDAARRWRKMPLEEKERLSLHWMDSAKSRL